MKKQAKKTKTVKKTVPKIEHKLGDRFAVNDVFCEIRFINAGAGFLFPIVDDPEDPMTARHICYGKVSDTGTVSKL